MDSSGPAVFVVRHDDIVETWSDAASACFETPAAEAIGARFRDLDLSYRATQLRAALERLKRLAHPERVVLADVTLSRRDGTTDHLRITLTPVLPPGGLAGVRVEVENTNRERSLEARIVALTEARDADAARAAAVADQHRRDQDDAAAAQEELLVRQEVEETMRDQLHAENAGLQADNERLAADKTKLEDEARRRGR
jgi:PAS domain-containing protein